MGDNNQYLSITDMNDLPLGNYTFWLGVNRDIDNYPPCTHPSGSVRSFVQVITQQTDGFKYQRVINVIGDNNNKMEIFERIKKGSGASWGDWYRTDNYGTSSLSELASLLGVFEYRTPLSYITDANNLPIGKWVKSYSTIWSNMPNGATQGTWLFDVNNMGTSIIQSARDIYNAALYYRSKIGDASWGAWTQV